MEAIQASGWLNHELLPTRESTGVLLALFEGHPDMLAIVDAQGNIAGANTPLLSGFGYSRQELEGQSIGLLLPEPVRHLHERHVRDYTQDPRARAMNACVNLRARNSKGSEFAVNVMLWPFLCGHAGYTMAVCRRLNAEIEKHRITGKNTDEHAIYTLDAQGRIVSWGAGAQKLNGYTADEVLGRHYSMLSTPEDRQEGAPELELAHAAATGCCFTDSWRTSKDGTLVWSSGVISAVRDGAGALNGFIRVARDRTEEKRFADAREQWAAELELRVVERTRQLEDSVEELRRKNEEAQAYAEIVSHDLREKEVLLGEIHHRVKNNLQVVQSLLKMRARLLPAGAVRTAIDTTVERVNAMALVHERLYQMPDLAGLPLSRYLQDLFCGVIASSSLKAGQVRLELETDDISLTLDRAIPFGLLMNELVSNSLKHAFPNGRCGTVAIAVHRIPGAARVIVKDNGRGLPENFDAGSCPSMGLKLAASLAPQLGGKLEFTNRAGCCIESSLTRL
jgi:PAS domain S-box-containing protein